MIISLIGYRGTGKSTVAPALAHRLQWAWCDADAELEHSSGRLIRDIFATDGEPTFRDMERATIVRLLQRDRLVLAAGGGAILNPETRSDFRRVGPVVWLKASISTIADRLKIDQAGGHQRPSLTGKSAVEEIADVIAVREPLYHEAATITVSTDQRPVSDIVDEILAQLPTEWQSGCEPQWGEQA